VATSLLWLIALWAIKAYEDQRSFCGLAFELALVKQTKLCFGPSLPHLIWQGTEMIVLEAGVRIVSNHLKSQMLFRLRLLN